MKTYMNKDRKVRLLINNLTTQLNTVAFSKLKVILGLSPLTREIIFIPIVLSCIFFLTFGQFLSGTSSIATGPDNTFLILPLMHSMSETLSYGEFPFWMNTIMGGIPLYDSPQLSSIYPFYFLNFGLYKTPLDAIFQVNLVTILHYLILLINTYIMLRLLKLKIMPSLLGACLLTLSANMFSYGVWLNIIAPYSWFPLVVGSVFLILENTYPKTGVFLGILSFSLLVQASPAQPLIHTIYVIGILYVCSSIRYIASKQINYLVKSTLNLMIMGVVSLLIASPALIPTILNTKNGIRFIGNFPPVVGDEKIPFEGFLVGQFDPIHLTSTLLPLQTPQVIGSSYIGLGAVFLSLFAIFKVKKDWVIIPFIFLALYGLLSATGSNLGFAQINYQIPFINKIREPVRHIFLFLLGVSVLTPFGLTYLVDTTDRGFRALFYWKHLLIGLVYVILLGITLYSGLTYIGSVDEKYLIIAFVAMVVLILLISLMRGWHRNVLVVVIMVLVIASALQYKRNFPLVQNGDYFSPANLNAIRVAEEISKTEDIKDYRVYFNDTVLNPQFWAMNGSYFGLRGFTGYMNPIPNQTFEQLLLRTNVPNYFEMLGGKYYICLPSVCDASKNLLKNYTFNKEIAGYNLYTTTKALPHYFLIDNIKGSYKSVNEFFSRISQGYDYFKSAYVPAEMAALVADWLKNTQPGTEITTNIRTEKQTANTLTVSLTTKERVIFVLNEFNTPEWHVKVNGVPTPTFNVNLNQVGVMLDSGSNLVQFEYKSEIFNNLLLLRSLVIILTCLTLAWFSWKLYSTGRLKRKALQAEEPAIPYEEAELSKL